MPQVSLGNFRRGLAERMMQERGNASMLRLRILCSFCWVMAWSARVIRFSDDVCAATSSSLGV